MSTPVRQNCPYVHDATQGVQRFSGAARVGRDMEAARERRAGPVRFIGRCAVVVTGWFRRRRG